jgi:hypothetical protein
MNATAMLSDLKFIADGSDAAVTLTMDSYDES